MWATRFPPFCGGEGGGELARYPRGAEGREGGPPSACFNPRDQGRRAELTKTPAPLGLDEVGVARSKSRSSGEEEEGEVGVQRNVFPPAGTGRVGTCWV